MIPTHTHTHPHTLDSNFQVAELVTSEFFEQGDRERSELKLTPSVSASQRCTRPASADNIHPVLRRAALCDGGSFKGFALLHLLRGDSNEQLSLLQINGC